MKERAIWIKTPILANKREIAAGIAEEGEVTRFSFKPVFDISQIREMTEEEIKKEKERNKRKRS